LQLAGTNRRTILLALGIAAVLYASSVAASPRKRSKADRNINAIGLRHIIPDTRLYTPAMEKKRGDEMSAAYERRVTLLLDPAITTYVDAVAQRLAQNSDSTFPIKVRIVETNKIDALTLPGGYQYMTRGLLLNLQNEGELASVLAHGIAHTALYSHARQALRAALMQISLSPPFIVQATIYGEYEIGEPTSQMFLSFQRDDELDADYFGLQYAYKAGYDPECFLGVIQRLQPVQVSKSFSPFPPVAERVQAIQKEIATILPIRANAVVATHEFADFQQRLRSLPPLPPVESNPMPKLIRHETQSTP
jgi:predicted Zn-dependent protease